MDHGVLKGHLVGHQPSETTRLFGEHKCYNSYNGNEADPSPTIKAPVL